MILAPVVSPKQQHRSNRFGMIKIRKNELAFKNLKSTAFQSISIPDCLHEESSLDYREGYYKYEKVVR